MLVVVILFWGGEVAVLFGHDDSADVAADVVSEYNKGVVPEQW